MASDRYDPDETFSLDMDPKDGLGKILEGAGTEDEPTDSISDPGVEGGVDAPIVGIEESETES